jgi:hypothetical protein
MRHYSDGEVNLLWSGGWDSTFRLLYLVFVEKRCVQPYYIIDVNRDSTLHELRAMHAVREEIAKKNPQLANLVKPIIIISIDDIKPDLEITAKFNRLNESLPKPIGLQYEWLARFAKQWKIPNLELCIELSEHTPNTVGDLVSKYVNGNSGIRRFDENDDASIFSFFSFPLLKMSKLDMKRIATEKGFIDMLEKTWFCYKPRHNRPCGICDPCELEIKEGLGYRMPRISRLQRKIWIIVRYLNKTAQKIFQFTHKKKE